MLKGNLTSYRLLNYNDFKLSTGGLIVVGLIVVFLLLVLSVLQLIYFSITKLRDFLHRKYKN